MAVLLFTDVYATVAQADARLNSNAQWTSLQTAQKESILINAAATFDDAGPYSGAPAVNGQPMQFPRSMGNGDYYTSAQQTVTLRDATMKQVEHLLSVRESGNANFNSSPGVASPLRYPAVSSSLSPAAYQILRPYMRTAP